MLPSFVLTKSVLLIGLWIPCFINGIWNAILYPCTCLEQTPLPLLPLICQALIRFIFFRSGRTRFPRPPSWRLLRSTTFPSLQKCRMLPSLSNSSSPICPGPCLLESCGIISCSSAKWDLRGWSSTDRPDSTKTSALWTSTRNRVLEAVKSQEHQLEGNVLRLEKVHNNL